MINQLLTKYFLRHLRNNLGKSQYFSTFKQIQNIANEGLGYGNDDIIENAELNLIKRLAPSFSKNAVVFDVGANVGNYLKHWINYEAKIYAFEPSESSYVILNKNWGDKIVAVNKAIGAKEEKKTLYTVKEDDRLNSLQNRQHPRHQWKKGEEIECITLDSFCNQNEIIEIDFLKIDVEGFEYAVLQGAKDMLLKTRYIQFEFGGAHIEAQIFFRDFYQLLNPKFKLYHILLDGIVKITEYDEKLENFKGTNYLAIKR